MNEPLSPEQQMTNRIQALISGAATPQTPSEKNMLALDKCGFHLTPEHYDAWHLENGYLQLGPAPPTPPAPLTGPSVPNEYVAPPAPKPTEGWGNS